MPLWSKAYNALVGLYFPRSDSQVKWCLLVAALGADDTIAERLAKPADRSPATCRALPGFTMGRAMANIWA